MTYPTSRRTITDAELRRHTQLHAHLRDWHGIAPGVLARHPTLRDLEEFHDDIDDGCQW